MNINMPLDQVSSTGASVADTTTKLAIKSESDGTILGGLMDFVSSVPDFRRLNKGNIRHRLGDIIILMLLGRICGYVGRADIIEFGKHNLNKFQKMGMLKRGVPSESTLCRVEKGIDDQAMADKMREFAKTFYEVLLERFGGKDIICIDGKAERGTVQSNGCNPDIVSAHSFNTGIVLATEPCQEKSNEIKAVPLLLDKIDISGMIVTADAMSMQKSIIDKIRKKGGDFMIELKANQKSLFYTVEDRIAGIRPVYSYTVGPELGHGRIETRTYGVYDGINLVVDKEKWGDSLTIVECHSDTVIKSTGFHTSEKRLYACSLPTHTPALGRLIRDHWSIESMHWMLDFDFEQDSIKRKSTKAARNLDTIQRMAYTVFSIWRAMRKKRADKEKGIAELMRGISMSFTKLIRFLRQK